MMRTVCLALFLGILGAAQALQPPTVLLHLSDIHLANAACVAKYWGSFGDREGDLELFASKLLPWLAPEAALLTGDLTDSKNYMGAGVQQEVEWQAYRRVLDALVAGGIPESHLYDIRGNHDVFNMPLRGGANDFFARYAAEGRRAPPAKRIFSHLLSHPSSSSSGGGGGKGFPSGEGSEAMWQGRRLAGTKAGSEGQRQESPGGCPVAAMLGIDVSPEPGLRSPANFAGVNSPALLHELKSELDSIQESIPSGCPQPAIVAYGHYPLSTIDTPTHTPGPLGMLSHVRRSMLSMQGITKLLADYNVTTFLSGHLHAAFGQRLHRLHPTAAGGHLAELETSAWKDDRRFRILALDSGTLSFADLFFHAPGSPRQEGRREDSLARKDSAWREAYQQRGFAVTSTDPSASVIDHIALITWPPDARYSPLAPGSLQQPGAMGVNSSARGGSEGTEAAGEGQQEGLVRALLFPLDAEAAAGPEAWEVSLESWLPGGAEFAAPARMKMKQGTAGDASGGQLFQAVLEAVLDCSGSGAAVQGSACGSRPSGTGGCAAPADRLFIQAVVRGRDSRMSTSAALPVGLSCTPLPASAGQPCLQQRCVPTPTEAPLPLGVTWMEWVVLLVNWPVVVHRMFLLGWAGHVGLLLLLPRMLRSQLAPRVSSHPLFRPRSATLLASSPAAAGHAVPAPPMWQAGLGAAWGGGLVAARAAASYVLWPVAALPLLANETAVWMAMVLYCVYLVAGPWYVAEMVSGWPSALMFSFGVLLRVPPAAPEEGSSWRFVDTSDVMMITLVHYIFCVVPLTLWVACVVGTRQLARAPGVPASSSRLSSGGSAPGSSHSAGSVLSKLKVLTVPQLMALAAIVGVYGVGTIHKAWSLNGAAAVLLSPGFAWTIPLAVLLVLWQQLPDKSLCCMRKRE